MTDVPLQAGRSVSARLRSLLLWLTPFLPALRVLGFIAAVAIVVVMAARAARDIGFRDVARWPLPLAFAGAAAWWLLQAGGWALLASGGSRRQDMSMWCRTQALRYLPGGIWAPASRATTVRGSLLDKVSTVAAENFAALCAALTIGGLAFAAAGDLLWLPLVLLVGAPPAASRLLAGRTRIAPARTLRATGNYLIAFLAYSASAVTVQAAVSGLQDPLAVAGAAAVAWSVGFIIAVTPSGLGVREVTYVGLLAGTFPTAELAAAAVILRVVSILAELAVLVSVGRPVRRRGAETPHQAS